jgi:protease YdgD
MTSGVIMPARANRLGARLATRYSVPMSRAVALLAFCLVVAVLSPSGARASPQRIHVDAVEYPWSAVGRLNVGGHSYCSAVLVADNLLLTAAHCLWYAPENRWWPASAVHFVPAYQGGEAPLHSLATRYVVADCPAIDAVGCPKPHQPSADWAVVELAEPLGRIAGWIAVGGAASSDPIGRLGYRAETRHALTLDFGCSLLRRDDSLFTDDCGAVHGDSGGPVLAFQPDGPHLIGITIAVQGNGHATWAVSIAAASFADHDRFPQAVALLQAAAVGRGPGHPPSPGGPADPLPVSTIRALDPNGTSPPSFARLRELLAKTASSGVPAVAAQDRP